MYYNVIEYLDYITPGMDREISNEFKKILTKQGIKFQLGSKVTKSSQEKDCVTVTYENQGKEIEKKFDKLIVAVGRSPNSEGVIDEGLNISINKGFIEVNEFCQTAVSNIWAVGDVVRGPMLAHKGSEEGIMVAERIAETKRIKNSDSFFIILMPINLYAPLNEGANLIIINVIIWC